MVIKKFFITGIDTAVGKTIVGCLLLRIANSAGYCAIGYKPVASGCKMTKHGLRSNDALALQKNSKVILPYEQINPFAFAESTAPHILSKKTRKPISFNIMSINLRKIEEKSDWIIIEGVGGWYTPISPTHTLVDWVIYEHTRSKNIKVILVVNLKLGCINHAILTRNAINSSNLPLAGWIANCNSSILDLGNYYSEYINYLTDKIDAPLLGELPYLNFSQYKNENSIHRLILP